MIIIFVIISSVLMVLCILQRDIYTDLLGEYNDLQRLYNQVIEAGKTYQANIKRELENAKAKTSKSKRNKARKRSSRKV